MFQLNHKTQAYASHQPVIYEICKKISGGKIIEYGAGNYSTSLLHLLCQKNNNELQSIDNDIEWLNKLNKEYPGYHWHSYTHVKDYTDLLDISHNWKCDVAFVDGYTYGTRLFCIEKSEADFVIVHDADFITGGHKEVFKYFNYYNIYDKIWTPTIVFSKKYQVDFKPDFDREEVDL